MDKIIDKISIDFLQKHLLLPVEEEGTVKIGVCPESNVEALEDIRLVSGIDIEPVYLTREQIDLGLREIIVKDLGIGEAKDDNELEILAEDTQDLLSHSKDAPIIKLVNTIFLKAVHSRGTDIHLEPYENDCRLRIRTDGVLQEIMTISRTQFTGVVARIKVMSKLNLAEHRLPQDGRMRVKAGDNVLDVRVSILPTQFGERIVLRVLDKSMQVLTLESLGFLRDDYDKIKELISHPYGSILLTGPTGSGKSTSLYAMLQEIISPHRNIITIEDPVEYQIHGIGQIPVNPKIGITFASGLRSILRQDPDVIMVGEIRDPETAEIVTHASLTGHLVLSTLHTNDAPTAVSRLVDMGVESYLISSSVIGIIAQRLVRKLCEHCREAYKPRDEELSGMGLLKSKKDSIRFHQAKGCPQCLNTGYFGRIGVFEVLTVDDDLRSTITRSAEANVIRKVARDKGMRNLMEDGAEKVIRGTTSFEEVLRATRA